MATPFTWCSPAVPGTTPLSIPVDGFYAGISALGFTAPATFNAQASYSLDLTVGTTGTTPSSFYFQTPSNNDPLNLTVTLPVSAVPTLNGTFGPFQSQAVPNGTGDMLDVVYSINLLSPINVNGATVKAVPVLNGDADLNFGLTLGFAPLNSSTLNPELTASLELNWPFQSSLAEVPLTELGGDPTLTMSDIKMDFGPILTKTIGNILDPVLAYIQPLVTLANVFAAPNPALQKLGDEINGLIGNVDDSSESDTDESNINTLLSFLSDPSLDNLIITGAQVAEALDPSRADDYSYAENVAYALEAINSFANVATAIQELPDELPDFGSFTLGGPGSDLRTASADALAGVGASGFPFSSSCAASGAYLSGIANALALPAPGPDDPLQLTLKIPMLDNPVLAFQLLMGSRSVPIVEPRQLDRSQR